MNTFNEIDLLAFKKWLEKFVVPCSKCNFTYTVPERTIDLVELSSDPDKPFRFNTHDIYACTNPNCDAAFSYPDEQFVRAFLKTYKRE